MPKVPNITEAEWEVMKVLWARSPQTSGEVVDALSAKSDWKPNTIRTLLQRLVRKGALRAQTVGREHSFRPAVSEAQCARSESKSFLRRVYDGAAMPMIAGFLENEKLSREEIAELRRLLDSIEKGK